MEFLFFDWLGKPLWMWLAFLGIVIALLVLDLGVLHRKQREIGARESLLMSAFYIMLGLASGICAHLLSPMHSCLVMTLEYYQAGMGKTYRLIWIPVLFTFLTGVAVFLAAS